jgi:hypothetical protein
LELFQRRLGGAVVARANCRHGAILGGTIAGPEVDTLVLDARNFRFQFCELSVKVFATPVHGSIGVARL